MHDFKLAPVNPERCVSDHICVFTIDCVDVWLFSYGQFHGGDSYVLQYTYIRNRREEDIIYFWLGNKSSQDEKGAAALLAKEKDDSLGGRATQVRVVQGKEPAHFRQLFQGRLIIHEGGHASGFSNATEGDSYDTDGVALFHVRGSNSLNTVAIQVPEKSSSLNSEDAFVLVTPTHAFAWHGQGGNEEEAGVALNVANSLAATYNGTGGRVVEVIAEGSEPDHFWESLGGKGEYPARGEGVPPPRDPRLFHCSDAYGKFTVEEVCRIILFKNCFLFLCIISCSDC